MIKRPSQKETKELTACHSLKYLESQTILLPPLFSSREVFWNIFSISVYSVTIYGKGTLPGLFVDLVFRKKIGLNNPVFGNLSKIKNNVKLAANL